MKAGGFALGILLSSLYSIMRYQHSRSNGSQKQTLRETGVVCIGCLVQITERPTYMENRAAVLDPHVVSAAKDRPVGSDQDGSNLQYTYVRNSSNSRVEPAT